MRQPVKPARHLSDAHATTPTHAPNTQQPSKADKELLFKGVTCALIGLVIVLAPYIARSGDVRELMGQVAAVGWFALVLGGAFIVQYVVRRVRAGHTARTRSPPCPPWPHPRSGRASANAMFAAAGPTRWRWHVANTTARAHHLLRAGLLQRLRVGRLCRRCRVLAARSAAGAGL